jgi:putative flavoprotein involved in K+ transport
MSGVRQTETVVVGGGQAGLALSRHLRSRGRAHVVLERGRIGERWRSERWDSLTLLSPAWANVLPGQEPGDEPDAFTGRRAFVEGLDEYARSFDAPVVEDTTVLAVEPHAEGYAVHSDRGTWRADNVVLATGDCDVPLLPATAASVPPGLASLHASRYRRPDTLSPGGVLVVGAGPTGQQLALELARSGRSVTIAVGRHARLPRRYRGRDIWEWLDVLGDLDVTIDEVADPERARRTPSVVLAGSEGGEHLDLGVLQRAGVDVRGRLTGFAGRHALFGDGLARDVAEADTRMRRILSRIDERIEQDRLPFPTDDVAAVRLPVAQTVLDLEGAGIGTVLWATGYRRSYPWLHVPVLDPQGELIQRHGVTRSPGLYTLGLKFQRLRRSHMIGGVGADAALLARCIAGGASIARRLAAGLLPPAGYPVRA